MVPAVSENKSDSSNGSDKSKAKTSAKEALQNLEEILNSENLSEKHKSECRNLLTRLSGIFCKENGINGPNRSGHSSIEPLTPESCEVLDLRKRSSGSESEQVRALDLSVNEKNVSGSRVSVSLKETSGTPNQSGLVRRASESSLPFSSKEFSRNQSNLTGSSNASSSSLLNGPITGKLKLRKASSTKSGPVKAIPGLAKKIPTPKSTTEISKIKKTSTPVSVRSPLRLFVKNCSHFLIRSRN